MILKNRQFTPLWVASLLGAMNDNLARAAIIVLAIQTLTPAAAAQSALLATGLMMMPFFLFSAWSGALADKFDKTDLLRVSKVTELGVACGVAAFFIMGLPLYWAFGLIFLMGAQSAFFGPIKQGWLPERLSQDELVKANAWMDAGTQLSIVAGTVLGGVLMASFSPFAAAIGCVTLASVGLAASFLAKRQPERKKDTVVPKNIFAGNFSMAKQVMGDPSIRGFALLQMWFWAAGAVVLSILPTLVDDTLQAGGQAATPVMALFSVGIALGAAGIAIVLGSSKSLWTTPVTALGLGVGAIVTWISASYLTPSDSLLELVQAPATIFLVLGIITLAGFGGAFVVPLHAALQRAVKEETRAQQLAGFNVLTSLSIVVATGIAMGLVALGLSALDVLGVLAAAALIVAGWTAWAMPREALQALFRVVFFPLFRVEVVGRQHLETPGPIVFAPNHISLLDGPLLFGLLERETSIAVDTNWAKGKILRRLKNALSIAPIDPQRPISAKALAKDIAEGGACVIFPEGRISVTGSPMKVNSGAAWLIDTGHAQVVPIHIEGLERSKGAKANTGWKRIWFPKVRVFVGHPRSLDLSPELRGKARREAATHALKVAMEDARFEGLFRHKNLPEAVQDAASVHGRSSVAYCDIEGLELTRGKIAIGAAALSLALPSFLGTKKRVGVLLPAAPGAGVVMLAFWKMNRTPALLNPTVGAASVMAALKAADADTVLTSQAFVEKGKFQPLIDALIANGIDVVLTEDVRETIGLSTKLKAIAFKNRIDRAIGRSSEAAVLFTSGTEGDPKGVVLTHGNLLANVAQLRARTDIGPLDRSLSALPLFHSFGLTAGMVLPLLAGIKTGLHPSPLHYRLIPLFAGIMRPTIMFGTDTFLQGWARRAAPEDFASLRAAVAGAEPLKAATRDLWAQKFGVRVLEGYGATECGPVLSLTTPAEPFSGTVGRLLPGMTARLEDIPGVEGKRLFVSGPNVMAGYVKTSKPGVIEPVEDNWYDTGDAVTIDNQGLIRIVGRVKRFAKVGGEMVSLAGVETLASKLWSDSHVAAIALPDGRTGEKVILFVSDPAANRQTLQEFAKSQGVGAILVPGEVLHMDHIPLLASGKTDYPKLIAQTLQTRAG